MKKLADTINAIFKIGGAESAIEFEELWWSWAELSEAKSSIGSIIDAEFARPGVRVGILLRNRPELVPPVLATICGGQCLVTLNAAYPDEALAEEIERETLPLLIGAEQDLERPAIRRAVSQTGIGCIRLSPAPGSAPALSQRPAETLRRADTSYRPGIAIEMLSSGTTGKPKRIPMKSASFEKAVLGAAAFEAGRRDDDQPRLRGGVQLLTAPFAHISGLLAVCNAVVAGRKSCLLEKFKVEQFRSAIVRHRPTVAGAPPAALKMLMDAEIPSEDFSSLRAYRTGTAPLDPDLADSFYARYGIPVLQNYGATEFGGVAGWSLADFEQHREDKRGAVGRLNPGISGRAVDAESGEPLSSGEQGVLELRGRQIGDGENWVRTTDLAIVDDDNFLWIKGRADGAIIRGGFKIQPEDLVEVLEQHEAVREAAVVGIADERLGAVPVAGYLGVAGARDPAEAELFAHMRARLTAYQMPSHIVRLDEFPRTVSLKVDQSALRELLSARVSETSKKA